MKILTLPLFLCAFLALSQAAAFPDNEDEPVKEETDLKVLPEAEALNWTHPAATNDLIRRGSCSYGWWEFNGRCFRYFPISISWANAQRNCVSMQASLASVHSFEEYHFVQNLIYSTSYDFKEAWLGGSDAQEEGIWLWSDGTPFHYSAWCPGEPVNGGGNQHCLQMNHGGSNCWDDLWCSSHRHYVCSKKNSFC
ncbi:ladderlectin [Kryptolebias marmoratus]|uniref:ladderlectin n=1 Tax=Kryptolebias marmoratus TaxID=37003 RepID=UPI0018ACD6BD|nr:ladderlectin [Kryptolebias marmoratus]